MIGIHDVRCQRVSHQCGRNQFTVRDEQYFIFALQQVWNEKGHTLNITRLLEYPAAQQMYLEIREKFHKKETFTLRLRFQFWLSRELEGFYISSYHTVDGETK